MRIKLVFFYYFLNSANAILYPLAHSWYNGDNIVGKSRNFMPYVGGVENYKNICD